MNQRQKVGSNPVCQEAVVTNTSKVFVRDMHNKSGYEVHNLNSGGLLGVIIMIQVFKGDEFTIIFFNSSLTYGRALYIFA